MTDHQPYDDKALFQRISEGDEVSFTTVFREYTPKLYTHLLKLTRDEHQARELMQETFFRLWTKRELLAKVTSPQAYLFKLAANLSNNYMAKESTRRRHQERFADTTSPFTYSEEVITAKEIEGIVARAVDGLPTKQKQVYQLSREQGLNQNEIAEQMGISLSTVNWHIGAALKTLAEAISKETGLSLAVILMVISA